MVSDRMKKLNVESSTTGQLYAMERRRRLRGRHFLLVLLVVAAGFGMYRGLRGSEANLPGWKGFFRNIVSRAEKSPPAGEARGGDPDPIRLLVLHPGETPGEIARGLNISGLNPDDLQRSCKPSPFESIRKNDELLLLGNRGGAEPARLVYLRSGGGGAYSLWKSPTGWRCGAREKDAGGAGTTAGGQWSKSFYHSFAACGIPAPLIGRLADIFSSEVDVVSDLKAGDSISVFFQKYPIASSPGKRFLVLGAQMSVGGKVYQAIGFDEDGSWDYFDARGASLERPFSKIPLNFRALLKENGGAVLKVFRPRFDIMYIVPVTVPVCAIGDGVVRAVNRRTGGRCSIEIRHGGGYSSWYGNLAACSPGLKRGTVVHRATVIGSPGSYGSGKAYFDFQFLKNGRPINFETAEFAPARSIPEEARSEFVTTREVCLDALRRETMKEKELPAPSGKN